jgi:hypothetical protein
MPSSRDMTATGQRLMFALATMIAGLGGSSAAGAPAQGALRELTTDRPDATESPFTVDAGHAQLEMDGVSYTRNRLDGVRTTEWVLAPFNVRYGLAPNFEAGIFVVPHVRVTEQDRNGPKRTVRGIGDTTLRMKLNLRGNDGGPTAFGLMADLKLPTAAEGLGNDRTEGGLGGRGDDVDRVRAHGARPAGDLGEHDHVCARDCPGPRRIP